jgi:hypothetical protein
MAHLFIDDGQFEAEDYSNNYIYFDGQNPKCVEKMQALARTLARLEPERKRALLDKIQTGQARVN